MLEKVIGFSIRNKLIIGLLTMALIISGVYNFLRLPIDAVPDITNNQVQVITIAPSLAPQEVEQFITFPVEIAMANIQDVTEIRSISRFGLSVVTIVFKDNVDILKARQRVSEQINVATGQIPEGYGKPEMMPITTGLGEIYQYVLEPEPGFEGVYSAFDLRTIQDWIVKRQLSGIPGIVEISTFGGLLKQYEVAINPRKLVGMNITIREIFDALEHNNQNSGGSYIEKQQNAYYIRTEGIVKSKSEIENIPVKKISGIPILIRDIAEVKIGAAPRFGAMTKNGKGEAVGGITLMLKGGNSSNVIVNVKERMEKVQKMLPPGLTIKPYLDRSLLIKKTISTVTRNLVEGGLIVIFVLVLLLGNFRSGIVVASIIPLSMLFAISMMNLFGVSANLMSLGAIDFGLIVDGSVIVVEGIIHQLHKGFPGRSLSQDDMDRTVYQSGSKVSRSAVFGVLIILIVYLPIFAFSGIEGKMFKPMAQTVSFALIGALILSFTYVPMISTVFLKKKITEKKDISYRLMAFLHRQHDAALRIAMKIPYITIGVALLIVIISLWVFTRMGGEFLPTLEEGDMACQMTLMPGTSLSQSIATTTRVEQILKKQFPEVIDVVSKIGSAEIPTDPMAIEDADIMITMKPKKLWVSAETREDMADRMKAALDVIPGASFDFSQPIQLRFNELMTGVKSDVAVKIFGEDLDVLFAKANDAAGIIRKIKGAGDVKVEQIVGLPQLVVRYRRDRIAQYGLNINNINSVVRTAFAGEAAGVVFENEKRFELVVRLDEEFRKNINALHNLRINDPDEELILLSQVADITVENGPMLISREQTNRRVTIGINVRNRDVESFINEVSVKLEKNLPLPPGYYISYGGQFENLKNAKATSVVAVPVALAAIFLMLFLAFGSLRQSVMIFTAIPLAAVGGIWALLIRGMPFSISAGVGFIALFGIAVLNGIVLISHYNNLKKEGISDTWQRIRQGTSDRLRPVVMTSLVAALGFLPMALSSAPGAEVQKPLATVVIGGILTSSVLTLVVLPVLYLLFGEGFSEYLKRIRRSGPRPAATALIFLLFSFPFWSPAQRQGVSQTLSLDEAVQLALGNNPEMKIINLEAETQKKLVKSAFDLNGPVLSWETGQINSALDDNRFVFAQDFDFPMVYVEKVRAANKKYQSSEILADIKRNEILADVRQKYIHWVISFRKKMNLEQQDSLFKKILEATKMQYNSGSADKLMLLMAENGSFRNWMKLVEIENEFVSAWEELKTIINVNGNYIPDTASPDRLSLPVVTSDSLSGNLWTGFYTKNLEYEKSNLRSEWWSIAPSFSIGGFSQSIDEVKGYSGWQFGISVPIWLWAPAGRIQASRRSMEIARNTLDYNRIKTNSQMTKLKMELEKSRTILDYFDRSALRNAGFLVNTAQTSYQKGEIDIFDYMLSLSQAFSIRFEYLEALEKYNQSVIQLNKFLGKY